MDADGAPSAGRPGPVPAQPRPILTVDMDGVLAAPPLGLPNLAISRRLRDYGLPNHVERLDRGDATWRSQLLAVLERLRYAGRALLPEVAEGLAAIAEHRELVLVTGRSWRARPLIEAWLARHGLRPYFSAVYANNTRLRSGQFKLWMARQLGAWEHVDDDGAIAYYLARHGLSRVFLRDWRRNRGLPYPPQVVVVRSLTELTAYLDDAAGWRVTEPPALPGDRFARAGETAPPCRRDGHPLTPSVPSTGHPEG